MHNAKRAIQAVAKLAKNQTRRCDDKVIVTPTGVSYRGADHRMTTSEIRVSAGQPPIVVDIADLKRAITGAKTKSVVAFDSTGETLAVTVDGVSATIRSTMAIDEMPEPSTAWRNVGERDRLTIPTDATLDRLIGTAAADWTRFQLHSVLIDGTDAETHLVSTDGKRLTLETLAASGFDRRVIVPVQTFQALRTVAGPVGAIAVEVNADGTEAEFTHGLTSIRSTMVTGAYPDWRRAMPEPSTATGWAAYRIADPKPVVATMRTAIRETSKETRSTRWAFRGDAADLRISIGPDATPVELAAFPTIEGDPEDRSVSLNPEYIRDALAKRSGAVEFYVRDARTAVEIRNGVPGSRTIVMPLVTQ